MNENDKKLFEMYVTYKDGDYFISDEVKLSMFFDTNECGVCTFKNDVSLLKLFEYYVMINDIRLNGYYNGLFVIKDIDDVFYNVDNRITKIVGLLRDQINIFRKIFETNDEYNEMVAKVKDSKFILTREHISDVDIDKIIERIVDVFKYNWNNVSNIVDYVIGEKHVKSNEVNVIVKFIF